MLLFYLERVAYTAPRAAGFIPAAGINPAARSTARYARSSIMIHRLSRLQLPDKNQDGDLLKTTSEIPQNLILRRLLRKFPF